MRLILALLLCLPAHAQADSAAGGERESKALDQETLDRAEALFFEGLAQYRKGAFEEAALRFQEAYVLTRHRDMLFNVARSRERLGDTEAAIQWYRSYLATTPSDETAIIHRIRQPGGDPTPVALPDQPEPEAPRGPTVVEKGPGVWPWVALGAGVVATGVGIGLGFKALGQADDARAADDRPTAQSLKDAAEQNALLADLSYGFAAVGVGAAVALWWLADAKAAESQGQIELSVAPNGVGLSGRF